MDKNKNQSKGNTISMSRETRTVQALGFEDESSGALVPPVHFSTTFARDAEDYQTPQGRSYLRCDGATQELAEAILADLESAEESMVFSSGIAACTAPFHGLKQGEHALISRTLYHGVLSFVKEFSESWGILIDYFETGNLEELEQKLIPGKTQLVWLETPANPTWAITDLETAAKLTHQAGALLAVDSTVATPVLTRPLELGADLVCHSATKYLNGHSDVLAGFLAVRDPSLELWRRVKMHRKFGGTVLGSMEAFLLIRGMKTLHLRVQRQSQNALELARYLEAQGSINWVFYPGLESNPGYPIAKKQMQGGFGGMLSFLVSGGKKEALEVLSRAQVFKRATSLGGVESLIEHRKSSETVETETPDNLIRMSVGIEAVEDLLEDLRRMLQV
jgi:cystathionine gamma-synthase